VGHLVLSRALSYLEFLVPAPNIKLRALCGGRPLWGSGRALDQDRDGPDPLGGFGVGAAGTSKGTEVLGGKGVRAVGVGVLQKRFPANPGDGGRVDTFLY